MSAWHKKFYLSGPMTGIEDYNFPAFHEAADRLRKVGHEVVNPAESHGGDQSLDYHTYLRWDIEQLLEVDAVVCLPGWESGTGARLEVAVALALGLPVHELLPYPNGYRTLYEAGAGRDALSEHLRMGVQVLLTNLQPATITSSPGVTITFPQPRPEPETILQEAQRLVHGDRGADYGHPLDDFTKTAKIWSAILGVEVSPEQVGLCMVGVKLSRQVNKPKRDNLVDGAGYFETVAMVLEEQERREHPVRVLDTNTQIHVAAPGLDQVARFAQRWQQTRGMTGA